MVLAAMLLASCSKKDETFIDGRDQYVATYLVNETYNTNGITHYSKPYSMTITNSVQDSNVIILSNFAGYGVGYFVKAEVSGNKFVFPKQAIGTRCFCGSGSLSNGNLSFTYQESCIEIILWNVTATATKQ